MLEPELDTSAPRPDPYPEGARAQPARGAPALLSGREARARVWTPALLTALALTLAVALAGHLMLRAGLAYSVPILTESTRAGAAAVGQAVAGQVARALDLGIPLDRIPDVEPWLERIAREAPQVRALALLDAEGRPLAATAPDVAGVSIPVEGAAGRATLVVAAASPLFEDAMLRLRTALWLAAALAGAAGGAVTAGFLGLAQEPARRRLRRAVRRAAEGDFAQAPPPGARGRFAAAAEALARQVERVQTARVKLLEAAATIRAIDFDGSLGRRIDPILAGVQARWTLPATEDDEVAVSGPVRAATPAVVAPEATPVAPNTPAAEPSAVSLTGDAASWRLATALALWAGAAPLAANFAIDRGSLWASVAWQPAAPLLIELLGLLLGALVGRGAAGRAAVLRALALALAGACVAATYWCRSWEVFAALRLGAGLGAGFAGAALAAAFAPAASPRAVRALLIFAALVAGPLAGGLLGEAVGRRAAFLALGALALFAAPLLAAGPARPRRAPPRTMAARSAPVAAGEALSVGDPSEASRSAASEPVGPEPLALAPAAPEIAALESAAGSAAAAPARGAGPAWLAAPALLAGLAAAPAASAALVWLPVGAGYDDYLSGGGLTAALGLAALLAPRLPAPVIAVALALAGAARFAAEAASAPGGPLAGTFPAGPPSVLLLPACLLLGLALGAAAPVRGGRGALAGLALGAAAGLLAAGLARQVAAPPGAVAVLFAAAALLVGGVRRRPGRG